MNQSAPGDAIVARLRELVQDALRPQELLIRDESAAHAGHATAGGKGHYRMHIVSDRFSGLSRIERHRLVHEIVRSVFDTHVHALALRTLTPDEKH
jgi:BolA protein